MKIRRAVDDGASMKFYDACNPQLCNRESKAVTRDLLISMRVEIQDETSVGMRPNSISMSFVPHAMDH